MIKNIYNGIVLMLITFALWGCCKDKNDCKSENFQVQPFIERYYTFTCGGNLYEYEYIKRKKIQIDSLSDCTFSPPVAFPIDETDMLYIMFGKMSYHYDDTFQTNLLKDTCLKKIIYEVNMIQRDTALWSNGGGVLSMFCSVENIPADYQVEVKYKYVPLGK